MKHDHDLIGHDDPARAGQRATPGAVHVEWRVLVRLGTSKYPKP